MVSVITEGFGSWTFVEMDSDLQHLFDPLFRCELQEVVNELYIDDAAALIENLTNVVKPMPARPIRNPLANQ